MDTRFKVVRSASLHGYVDLARSVGLDPLAMLRNVGLPVSSLEDPEALLSAEAVSELLEASAATSGVEDFGLRMASLRKLSNLGPISLVLREEISARQALDTLCRYLSLLNAALIAQIDEHEGLITIREQVLLQHSSPTRQATEISVGVLYRTLAELLGTTWKPVRVCFAHRAPSNVKYHTAFFGTQVTFNAEFSGMVCKATDLKRHLHGASPEMARFARQILDRALSRQPQSPQAIVRQLIVALLPSGRCTSQRVAGHLGVDRRTIHRQLTIEGESFSGLLQSVRSELALRQVRESELPLAEVAALLGFASHSAFSHWFSTTFGQTAAELRRGLASAKAREAVG
jgi:AraC-like DNA-binding protein